MNNYNKTPEKLSYEEALSIAVNAKWAYMRNLSDLYIGETCEAVNPSALMKEELLEGRYFSEDFEVKLINDGEQLSAYLLQDEGTEDAFDAEIQMQGRPGKLVVKKYVAYDEDGQAYICAERFCGLKEAE